MASGTDCCNVCPTVQVTSIPGAPGATGAQGPQGDPATMLPAQSFYIIGGLQNLTAVTIQLLGATITLPADGTYLLSGGIRIDYVNATTTANKTVYLEIYRTNNGAGIIANTPHELATGIVTAEGQTLCSTTFPTVVYTATAGDILHVRGSISNALTLPYESGSIAAIECWMLALPIT